MARAATAAVEGGIGWLVVCFRMGLWLIVEPAWMWRSSDGERYHNYYHFL